MVRDGAREERLARSGGPIQEDALGLGDAEGVEELGVPDGELDDLLDLLDLLVEAADHLVRRVGHLFDHHERDERVLLGRQDRVELVCGDVVEVSTVVRGSEPEGQRCAQESERRATRRLGVSWLMLMLLAKSTTVCGRG